MDLLFSIALTAFSVYCFFLVGAESPGPTPTELGAAFWPRIILVAMIALLVANIVNYLKANKVSAQGIMDEIQLGGFVKSKLFVGMLIVFFMALIMPYIGFIPSCLLFLMSYGRLLGERRLPRLILIALIVTIVLYALFQGPLSIMLPRGVSFFREFALICEGFLMF